LERENLPSPLDVRRSLLLNKLLKDDPYHGLHKPGRNPRHASFDLTKEAAFQADVEALKAEGVPILIVMLPVMEELEINAYLVDEQQKALIEGLRAELRAPVLSLFPYMAGIPREELETLFLTPHDPHPSPIGAKRYARAVAQALDVHWQAAPTPE
jgi:hypothetical protein